MASMEDALISCPISFGTIAMFLGKKADDQATHKWTLFVRGPNNEDITYFVAKVVFTLHPSFAQPVREILQPPFEVTEFGWGEFEASIRVFFQDPNEKPVDIVHPIRLYPMNNQPPSVKKPVVYELYDEIVFTNPAPEFYDVMVRGSQKQSLPNPLQDAFTAFSDADDIKQIAAAQAYVTEELNKVKDKISQLEQERSARERIANASARPR